MAIAFVKSTGKFRATSNPDSVSGSFASLPAAGNAVTVQAWAYDNAADLDLAAGGCTDNQSNSYSRAVRGPVTQRGAAADYMVSAIYYDESIGTPGGTFTITVNPAGTGSFGAIVGVGIEWSGFAASSLDVTQTAGGQTGSPTTGTTAATAQNDELALAVMGCSDAANADVTYASITVDGAHIERAEELDSDTYQAGEADSLILTTTGTQSATWTTVSPASSWYSGCIATFKAAVAGGAVARKDLLLLGVGQ